jgi:hypothetical protein
MKKSPIKHFTMYESKRQALASSKVFFKRLLWNFTISAAILSICLLIGVVGYHYLAPSTWIDAFHNASMILSGMGPVIEIKTDQGKWFSSFYALFSGIVFITNIGFILAPAIHRLFHALHLEEN